MFTAAQFRAIAKKRLAQAEKDDRHRRRLITAAEAWFFLANRLSAERRRHSPLNAGRRHRRNEQRSVVSTSKPRDEERTQEDTMNPRERSRIA
jgi:hypothetical protein